MMRKFLYILVLLSFLAPRVIGQTFVPRTNGTFTPVDPFLSVPRAFYLPKVCDTLVNPLHGGKDSVGAMIFDTCNQKVWVRSVISGLKVWIQPNASGGGGGGFNYIYSATAPTGADTSKIWIKTPAIMGVYDLYTYATGQFSWVRYAWLSVDGLLSFLPPINLVIAGQSNAAGIWSGGDTARINGLIGYSSGAINGGIDNPTTWQPVYIGISPFFSNNNNAAHAFAKEVIRKEKRIVRVIATYEGGTGIGAWNGRTSVGTMVPYLLDTLRQRLDRSGIDTVHVFLWLHGESPYPTSDVSGGYYSDFKCFQDSLFSPLTAGFYKDFTNIISCDMATDTSRTAVLSGASPQGAMRRLLNDYDPYTSFAAAYGVSLCDAVHFCGTALDTLGRRAYGAWKQMPRNLVDEEPKYSYDWVNDKFAFTTRIGPYSNGISAANIAGFTLGWINNTNPVFSLNGSTASVAVGSTLGYTNTVVKNFTVNGKATISDGSLNTIISGNWNVTGNPSHNVVIGNYISDFNPSSGGDESVLIGYNPGYTSSSNMPFNSVVIGSDAGNGNAGSNFNVYIGRQAAENVTGIFNTFVGSRAGRNSGGSGNTALGMDAGAINSSGLVNSTAIGLNAKYDADSQYVAGEGLKEYIIDGMNHRNIFDVSSTPSTGQAFVYNGTKFALSSAFGQNISNASLSWNGDYLQDVNYKNLFFDSVRSGRLMSYGFSNGNKGMFTWDTATVVMRKSVRRSDNLADSIFSSVFVGTSGGQEEASLTYFSNPFFSQVAVKRSEVNIFASENSGSSLINNGSGISLLPRNITIIARDSLEVSGVPIASADSNWVVGSFDISSGTNKMLKAPRLPYKQYVAFLTQTGTDAPVATVLENKIGSIVWTRNNVGDYTGTLSGAFTAGKTFIIVSNYSNNVAGSVIQIQLERVDNNSVTFQVGTGGAKSDNLLNTGDGLPIEIRVYP